MLLQVYEGFPEGKQVNKFLKMPEVGADVTQPELEES